MAIFKCKMCGGQLEITEGESICTCEYCGAKQTLPKVMDENLQSLFNRANVLRMKAEFDKAAEIYEKILQASGTEAEAYWGLILCKYGIEYVEDPETFKRVPTCHRASYDAVTADDDYKMALQYADVSQRSVYEAEARQIDEIQKGILALAQKEDPYDVFICYKETDENGKRTPDSVIANDIYYQLTQEGFKVFYAAITLEEKLGSEYEPCIFSALNSARVMLSIGTKPEYFNAVWVKNEWSRFLKIMKKDRARMLIPCYKDMDAYELPEEFAHLQAQDMGKIGFINDIVRGIKKVIVKDQPEKPTVQETVVVQQTAAVSGTLETLLKRGNMALEDGEWEQADKFFEDALNVEPECAEAFLGKWMAKKKTGSLEKLKSYYIQKYEQGKTEKLTACEADKTHIEEMVGKHTIDRYLDREQIRNLYKADRSYVSMLSCRKKQKEEELQEIQTEKLYVRTMQYAKGETKTAVDKMMQEITAVLDQRIDDAGRQDMESIAGVKASYKMAVETADKKVEEMYRSACKKKEADYQGLIEEFNKAVQIPDFEMVRDKLQNLGDYSGAKEYVQKCEEKITDMQTILQRKAEKKARKNKIIAGFCVTAVLLLIAFYKFVYLGMIIPANKYNNAIALMKSGKYDAAISAFQELGDYKDSKEKIEQSEIGRFKASKAGDYVMFGQCEWLVLETQGNQKLLITKNAIEERAYHSTRESVTWEKCDLRAYLNGTWLASTFTETERKMIVETSVKNADNSVHGTEGGKDTKDKVFLLSAGEVKQYYKSDSARMTTLLDGKSVWWWWLRSPGNFSNYAAYVGSDGSVDGGGRRVYDSYGAVRPALWIDVSNL